MSEMREPSPNDRVARHFAGRFVRRHDQMWYDLPAAWEVVDFCAAHAIAIVSIEQKWDWPEGPQHGIADHSIMLQRSLTWDEAVQDSVERARLVMQSLSSTAPGASVSFAFYTEAAWRDRYV